MKKLFFLSALFAAGLAVTSCSSDDVVAGNDGGTTSPEGDAYISLAIQLPTAPRSKADATQNDQFADGLAKEYAVKDATLILFEGNDASTATYAGNYALNLAWNLSGVTTDQITTTAKIVQKVTSPSTTGNKFYAYVVLNKPSNLNGVLTAATSTSTFTTLFQDPSNILQLPEVTDVTLSVDGTTNFIPMTNAPLADVSGGSNDPTGTQTYTVLAEIDNSKIYATEGEAASQPATSIYVERAYAKATVTSTETKIKKTDGTETSVEFTFNGWTLDNTNKTSYFQHYLGDYAWYNYKSENTVTDTYRFIGNNAVVSNKYRIYWAEDPNYNSGLTWASATDAQINAEKDKFNRVTSVGANPTGESNPLYCYENTFVVADQREIETTRALICLKFNNGDAFYTINNDYTDILNASGTSLKEKVINLLKANPTIFAAMQSTNNAFTAPTTTNSTIEFVTTNADHVSVKTGTGKITLGDGTYSITLDATQLNIVSELFNTENAPYRIRYYEGGLAYYPVLIKHFGDSDTPWSAAPHVGQASAYHDEGTAPVSNYLGRYGMVRNNWYELNVTKVTNIGSPVIPEPGTPEDDEVSSYIAVQINILAWAKRTQDVTL